MQHPVEFSNVVMMILGVVLVFSGPLIVYRTIRGMVQRRKADPKADLHLISNGINLVIASLFFVAGILFVLNNLRGNPLA